MAQVPLSDEKISAKLQGLLGYAESLVQRHPERVINAPIPQPEYVDLRTQAASFIRQVCGEESEYFRALSRVDDRHDDINTCLAKITGLLRAVQQDYTTGYLLNIRGFIRGEVLSDFLEQAEALHKEGYTAAAASVTGAVLEDVLRKLSEKHGVTFNPEKSNISVLNAELYKKSIYHKIVMSQIETWGKIRNEASHGRFDNVRKDEVDAMIKGVRLFGAEHLLSSFS